MTELKLIHPLKDSLPPLRFGEPLAVVADVVLETPWLELPNSLGRRLSELDGEPEIALSFETRYPAPVKALAGGRADVRDTGKDDHSGPPARKGSAGRGVEVTVKSGTYFEVVYSHLKRGTARVGLLKTGEVVGQSGNSGRCVDGAKSAYVKIAARNKGSQLRLDELVEPVFLEATINGYSIGRPKKLEPGELVHKGVALERVLVESGKEDIYRAGENTLVVSVKRGSRTLARHEEIVPVEW